MGKVKKALVFLLVAALTLGSVSMSAFAATTKKAVVSVSVTNASIPSVINCFIFFKNDFLI